MDIRPIIIRGTMGSPNVGSFSKQLAAVQPSFLSDRITQQLHFLSFDATQHLENQLPIQQWQGGCYQVSYEQLAEALIAEFCAKQEWH